MTVETLPGQRWACRGCASCCSSGFELGPVEPEVIADLRKADIAAAWAPAAEAPWFERRAGPEGEPLFFLRQRDGRCVFLRDDDLCAVHALLGGHRKPGFCREFPYHLVDTPRGTVAVVRPTCGGLHQTWADGPPVGAAELQQVAALPRVVPRRRFQPDQVEVLPGVAVELSTYLTLEDRALGALRAHPSLGPDAALALVRDTFVDALGASPPTPRPEQARAGASAVLLALSRVMERVLQQPGAPADRLAFARSVAEQLPRARARLEGPLPPVSEPVAGYLHRLLQGQLLAKQWQAWGSVHAGLGQHHLGVVVGRTLAHDDGLAAFDEPYRMWLRFAANAMIQHVLRSARVALTDGFLHTMP
jgi:Fe-S-cluster containining protein